MGEALMGLLEVILTVLEVAFSFGEGGGEERFNGMKPHPFDALDEPKGR